MLYIPEEFFIDFMSIAWMNKTLMSFGIGFSRDIHRLKCNICCPMVHVICSLRNQKFLWYIIMNMYI